MKTATTPRNGADLGKKAPPPKKTATTPDRVAFMEGRLTQEVRNEGANTRKYVADCAVAHQETIKKTNETSLAWLRDIRERSQELNGLIAALNQPTPSGQIDREIACIRSDMAAFLRRDEGNMNRLARVELLLEQLVAHAANKQKRKDAKQGLKAAKLKAKRVAKETKKARVTANAEAPARTPSR